MRSFEGKSGAADVRIPQYIEACFRRGLDREIPSPGFENSQIYQSMFSSGLYRKNIARI